MYQADYQERELVLTDGRLIGMMIVMGLAALLLFGSVFANFY